MLTKQTLENGIDMELDQVTDADTSLVKEIAYEPSIYIQATVCMDWRQYSSFQLTQRESRHTKVVKDLRNAITLKLLKDILVRTESIFFSFNNTGSNDQCTTGYNVTYCFTVVNTGDSYLGDVAISSVDLGYSHPVEGIIAPQDKVLVTFTASIDSSINITASVEANPTLEDGTDIPSAATVSSDDPAGQRELEYSPAITIDNLVAIGNGGDDACSSARNYVEGPVSRNQRHK